MSKKKYDSDKPSLAVVSVQGDSGVVLWSVGQINEEIEQDGPDVDALGLLDDVLRPTGIWVWGGRFREVTDEHGTYTMPKGAFREPTEAEWASIRRNESPWNDGLWLQPHLLRVN
jgi:hypothetical protein